MHPDISVATLGVTCHAVTVTIYDVQNYYIMHLKISDIQQNYITLSCVLRRTPQVSPTQLLVETSCYLLNKLIMGHINMSYRSLTMLQSSELQ